MKFSKKNLLRKFKPNQVLSKDHMKKLKGGETEEQVQEEAEVE